MRKIIHIDMDCFYAAIEMRDNPELQGRPIAVGGRADQRGVLCTCNYEARRFGVHSAMASAYALKLCPELVILPVNMNKYRSVSKKIQKIFFDYTDLVEPLSLDEAYLDVSNSKMNRGSATHIARDIRERIYREHKLTASAGVATNKFLAKIASDWRKPNGQFVISPHRVSEFLLDLPVKKIFGVGKVTADKLNKLDIYTCGQLRERDLSELQQHFGSFGVYLHQLARGEDDREVSPQRERKSLSVEETFVQDLKSEQECLRQFDGLLAQLKQRLSRAKDKSSKDIKGIFVKIKFSDFSQTTIQASVKQLSLDAFCMLFKKRYGEHQKPVRLLGVGVHFDEHASDRPMQLSLML